MKKKEVSHLTSDPLTKVELCIIQDALITYKYQSNCPKDKIRIIQKVKSLYPDENNPVNIDYTNLEGDIVDQLIEEDSYVELDDY